MALGLDRHSLIRVGLLARRVVIDCTPWAGEDIAVHLSLDDGATWSHLGGAQGCVVGGKLVVFPPHLCICGQPYHRDDPRYDRSGLHQFLTLRPGVTIDFVRRRMPPALRQATLDDFRRLTAIDRDGFDIDEQVFVRDFHPPVARPGVSRLLRVSAT